MSLPMFIPLMFNEQCEEIHQLFLEHKANISEKPKELDAEISELIRACDVCFKMPVDDAESVLNGFVSILVCKTDSVDDYEQFCRRLESAPTPKMQEVAFNVLYNFFEGLPEDCPNRIDVYCSLIKVAGKIRSVPEVFHDVASIKSWLQQAKCPMSKARDVYRKLHAELLTGHAADMALRVMVELLSTYSEEDAAEAAADAEKCIVTSLKDPATFLMDRLLPLKPIKALEGKPIHELLQIFVNGKLSAYQDFYQKNKEFVDGLDLSHSENVEKMRLLTFMLMAEKQREISFEDISRELEVTDVEEFTIRALKTKLVSAKINQMTRRVVVISTMHRTFDKSEWELLRDTLTSWYQRLEVVEQSTNTLVDAQAQYAVQAGKA